MRLLGLRSFSFLLLALLLPCVLHAEKVADLPMPTRYVEDFAGVLTPEGKQQLEDLCMEVHLQANAELEVVTIKSLDDGETVEDFTVSLEEKWKIGKKGVDRSALILLVLSPHKFRVETGYGLEGILPDAKVGRIMDTAIPDATAGNYDAALLTTVQGLADVVANDANVELTPIVHTYHQQVVPQQRGISLGQIIGAILVILFIVIMISTGNGGWLLYMLLNMIGGGGGGGRGGDGGGFGGSGGGESGGGGASRDF